MKHTITVYNVQKSQKQYIKDIATNNLLFVQKVSFAQKKTDNVTYINEYNAKISLECSAKEFINEYNKAKSLFNDLQIG